MLSVGLGLERAATHDAGGYFGLRFSARRITEKQCDTGSPPRADASDQHESVARLSKLLHRPMGVAHDDPESSRLISPGIFGLLACRAIQKRPRGLSRMLSGMPGRFTSCS